MLVERDPFLAALVKSVPAAASTDGCWMFLGGEAGVGKTSLVGLLLDHVAGLPDPAQVRRGFCDNVATPPPLGPVLDALPEMAERLEETTPDTRPRLFRDIRAMLAERPTVLVLEDVHWADEATLELVRFLGRRLDGLPLLAIATYRDDEVGPQDRLTSVLGDLATVAGVARMHLPSLSADAVAALVATAESPLDPALLHERTGGNPFFVTEVLASHTDEVPATVRDAVLARTARTPSAAGDALAAAAVLGPGATVAQVVEVSGRPAEAVDACLHSGLLVADPRGDGLAFRHEIARETVEASLAPAVRERLHAAAYRTLRDRRVSDDHRLAHHAAGSGDGEAALRHARDAAARSARLGAHREAVREYRLALRFAEGLDLQSLAMLHDALSYECYLTDHLEDALEERRSALALHEERGDLERVGAAERWLSRLSWFLGRGDDAARYGDQAVATLEPLTPGHELAMAVSNKAQLAMLAGDEAGATIWSDRAVALARSLGDAEVEAHALNNGGTASACGTDLVGGLAKLRHSLDLALAHDLHEHVARAYTNLGATLVQHCMFLDADRELGAGIAYCTERDLDAWRHYMAAWLAESYAEQGRLGEAWRLAQDVVRQTEIPPVSRIPALIVAGTVAARRDDPRAVALLDEARDLAAPTGEAQRIVPVAVARAEAAWTRGAIDEAREELAVADGHDAGVRGPWERGELVWWRTVVDVAETEVSAMAEVSEVSEVAEPFRLMIAGDDRGAADAWERLGCAWWRAVCLGRSASLADAREGTEVLATLGAPATRLAVLRGRRDAGLPMPRGPRQRTKDNPAGLTARELEVLTLLAEGLTNAQLAGRLFLSEKTVDHHVSSVLRKLGEPTRSGAVAAALGRGLLPNMGNPPDVRT